MADGRAHDAACVVARADYVCKGRAMGVEMQDDGAAPSAPERRPSLPVTRIRVSQCDNRILGTKLAVIYTCKCFVVSLRCLT